MPRSFSQQITMGKCKTEAIQADLDIFRDIQTYSGIIGHVKELFKGTLMQIWKSLYTF